MDRATFLKSAVGVIALARLGAGTAQAAPRLRGGVCYDTGVAHEPGGTLSRVRWSRPQLEREIRMIRHDLRCESITAFGTDVGRLTETTKTALRHELDVFVQPRLYDLPQADILEHMAESARQAETLRRGNGGGVTFVTGCEHFLFTPGIVPGANFLERIANLPNLPAEEFPKIFQRLNAFVRQAADVSRRHFRGPLTYGSATFEPVDWSQFDVVGLDYYEYFRTQAEYTKDLEKYRRWNKPIMILEFGSCTFVGAPEAGGMGWDAVDYEVVPPRLKDGIVRDEQVQADHIARMLGVFQAEGLMGAHVYSFISPDSPHHPSNPPLDLDTAAYSLLKSVRRTFEDEASPYRTEPKRSFHALARHNCR